MKLYLAGVVALAAAASAFPDAMHLEARKPTNSPPATIQADVKTYLAAGCPETATNTGFKEYTLNAGVCYNLPPTDLVDKSIFTGVRAKIIGTYPPGKTCYLTVWESTDCTGNYYQGYAIKSGASTNECRPTVCSGISSVGDKSGRVDCL